MSYVFQHTSHPSLQSSMALQMIQKDMAHSIPIHRCGWCSKTHLEVQKVSQSNFSSTHLLTIFRGSTSSIISTSLVNPLYVFNLFHLVNQLYLVNPLQPFNPLIIILNIHGDQLKEHLVCLPLHSCMVYFLTLFLRPQAPNYTNW